jgi:NADPH:quinone reductase-like Zn-dependent oxidoreductase
MVSATRLIVDRFGGADALVPRAVQLPPPGRGRLTVRILAASVGSTDLLARRGGYVFQPFAGFTPGYDFIGEIVEVHPSEAGHLAAAGLALGDRVAVCLPSMGAYASHRTIALWQAVRVPDALDTLTAAAIPLDYLTARSAFERHARVGSGASVLIQGASGPVGRAIAQLAAADGVRALGTASERNRTVVEREGVRFVDYNRDELEERLREFAPNGVDASFDHLGGASLRASERALGRGGIAVSYAFAGRAGHEKRDTIAGGARSAARGILRPGGRRAAVVTVPLEIRTGHSGYRDGLTRMLEAAVAGAIRPRVNRSFPLGEAASAHRYLEGGAATGKVLLAG